MLNFDKYGVSYLSSEELCQELYECPRLDISAFNLTDPDDFNISNKALYAGYSEMSQYIQNVNDIEEFDRLNQSNWKMPDEYKNLDIVSHVLSLCVEQHELQRVGQELLIYEKKNAMDLLRYLKYLVDTMRTHGIIWGVGRGSSVASYVLFLLGVHKIDSIYYDIPLTEFFKEI